MESLSLDIADESTAERHVALSRKIRNFFLLFFIVSVPRFSLARRRGSGSLVIFIPRQTSRTVRTYFVNEIAAIALYARLRLGGALRPGQL